MRVCEWQLSIELTDGQAYTQRGLLSHQIQFTPRECTSLKLTGHKRNNLLCFLLVCRIILELCLGLRVLFHVCQICCIQNLLYDQITLIFFYFYCCSKYYFSFFASNISVYVSRYILLEVGKCPLDCTERKQDKSALTCPLCQKITLASHFKTNSCGNTLTALVNASGIQTHKLQFGDLERVLEVCLPPQSN